MSIIGELQRYLDRSIDLLALDTDPALIDALTSAHPTSSEDLPSSAERILELLDRLGDPPPSKGEESLPGDALESLERLHAICRIILGQ